MIRKQFAYSSALLLSFIVEIYLMVNLFIWDKTWTVYAFAVAGFTLLPVTLTLSVRRTKLDPTQKVIVITGIWVAWTVLAAIAAFATYYYWFNNNLGYGGPSCGGGLDSLCPGALLK